METETTTISEFLSGGKATVEQMLRTEEINKSKRAGLWVLSSKIKFCIENIIYKNIIKNINPTTNFFHTSSYFFTSLIRALISIHWGAHSTTTLPPGHMLHLPDLRHVERPTAFHYHFPKSIRTEPTFDF